MTKFVSGQSGNPGGRPKESVELRELARSHATAAMGALVATMQDVNAPATARINAAIAVLDRAFGRPAVGLEVAANHENCSRCEWIDETLRSINGQTGLPQQYEESLKAEMLMDDSK